MKLAVTLVFVLYEAAIAGAALYALIQVVDRVRWERQRRRAGRQR